MDAFRSTLEEAKDADLILHVVDGSDADPQAQLSAVREVLAEIGAQNVPELVVINKIDDADPVTLKALQLRERDAVLVSAKTGEGLDELRAAIEDGAARAGPRGPGQRPLQPGRPGGQGARRGRGDAHVSTARTGPSSRPASRRSSPPSCSDS